MAKLPFESEFGRKPFPAEINVPLSLPKPYDLPQMPETSVAPAAAASVPAAATMKEAEASDVTGIGRAVPSAVADIFTAWMKAKDLEQQMEQERERQMSQVQTASKERALRTETAGQISPLRSLIADMRAALK